MVQDVQPHEAGEQVLMAHANLPAGDISSKLDIEKRY
jgi:hypothetical protein